MPAPVPMMLSMKAVMVPPSFAPSAHPIPPPIVDPINPKTFFSW